MTRDETKQVMFIIANEYPDFLPEYKAMQELKLNTWYESLKKFEFNLVQAQTIKLLQTHKFGTPKLAHLMLILEPPAENENIGQEFADKFISYQRKFGTEEMGEAIKSEFGEVGFKVYSNNKESARILLEKDILIFKAQIRDSFNSMYEREKTNNNKQLGHNRNDLIDFGVAKMAIEI